jgi:hypothetical protein
MATVTVTVTDKSGHQTQTSKTFSVSAPSLKPVVGASAENDSEFNALVASLAPGLLKCRRTYDGAIPSSFSASKARNDKTNGHATYWSWKPNPATFVNDTAQHTALLNFLNTVPAGHPFTVFAYHEPEDNIYGGAFTMAQWKAMTKKVGELIKSLNKPNIRFGICLMGPWTFDTRSNYYTMDWSFDAATLAVIDVIGIDPYKWNPGDPSLEQILTRNNSGTQTGTTNSCMTKLKAYGKPLVLTEWGCTRTDFSEAGAAAWITAAYNWVKVWNQANPATPWEAIIYFHLDLFAENGSEPRATWELKTDTMVAYRNACLDALA